MLLRRDAVKKRYRPGELAKLLNVSESTLRKLSDKFRDYLDDVAARRQAGASGRSQRRYTEKDERSLRRILELVHDDGLTYDEVLARLAQAAEHEAEQSTAATRSEVEELRQDNAWLEEQLRRQDDSIADLEEELRWRDEALSAHKLANEPLRRENHDLRLEQTLLRRELWGSREKLQNVRVQRDHAVGNALAWRRDAQSRAPVRLWRLVTGRN